MGACLLLGWHGCQARLKEHVGPNTPRRLSCTATTFCGANSFLGLASPELLSL